MLLLSFVAQANRFEHHLRVPFSTILQVQKISAELTGTAFAPLEGLLEYKNNMVQREVFLENCSLL